MLIVLASNPPPILKTNIDSTPLLRRVAALLGIMLLGAALDLWSKASVFNWRGYPGASPTWWVIDGYFGIETVINRGAVFGLGAGRGSIFAVLSVLAGLGIFVWLFRFGAIRSWYLTVALGCVLGGIIGNLYDRLGLWYGPHTGLPLEYRTGVRDWILWQLNDQWKWPNFNIADSLLVTGAIMMIVQSLWAPQPTNTESVHTSDERTNA